MALTQLAPELLHACLSHVGRKDLSQTSLVCRDWLKPSRDLYWNGVQVTLTDESVGLLAPALGEGTTVPRKIKAFTIDESDDVEYREAEDTASWQANLLTITRHFTSVSHLIVGCLNLSKFPAEQRPQVLWPGQVHDQLIIPWLKVGHAHEATSFILNQPDIHFLGVGSILLARDDENRDEQDGDEEQSKDQPETENKVEDGSVAIDASAPSPEPIVRLDKLRHLCLFSDSRGICWSHIVPSLTKGTLTELKTLVTNCHDREALVKLIGAAAPALRSVGVALNGPGADIDLSEARSLTNLSLNLAMYPRDEHILADTVVTVSSAPPSVEHVFFNVGPGMIKPEDQLDSAPPLWAALDATLTGMSRLRRVTIIMVLDSCMSMFVSMSSGGMNKFVEEWKTEALDYMKSKLPGCSDKGLLEVKSVFTEWTSSAFAGYDLPE